MLRYRLRFILRSHLMRQLFLCRPVDAVAAAAATMSKCNSNAHNWKINHEQISFGCCDAVVCALFNAAQPGISHTSPEHCRRIAAVAMPFYPI